MSGGGDTKGLARLVPLAAVAMLAVAGASLWYRLAAPADGTTAGYVTSSLSAEGVEVTVLPGAHTPLRAGDRVVAIAGTDLETWFRGATAPIDPRFGDVLAYSVLRDGQPTDVAVPLAPYPLLSVLAQSWSTVLFCIAMLLVGAYVYARRPDATAAAPLLLVGSGLVGSTVPWLLGFSALDVAAGPAF